MARQLQLDTREKIEIVDSDGNVTGYFRWNPSDFGIVDRLDEVYDSFDRIAKECDGKSGDDARRMLEDEIKKQFDYLISPGASDEIFKWNTPLSLRPDGGFYAHYALDVIGNFIQSELDVRIKKSTHKIEQYTEKYKK